MKIHQISGPEDPRVVAAEESAKASQPKIDNALIAAKADTEFLDYMIIFAVPIARTEVPLFRAVHPTAPASRTALRQRIVAHATGVYNYPILEF